VSQQGSVAKPASSGFDRVKRMRKSRPALFRGRHFREEIIVLCVRWYLRYPLSYRDLEEMMAERGLTVDHSTIARWVLHYSPILDKRIRREMRQPNRSWRVDETYIRVAGRWTYLYRAVDSAGDTIDFLLSPYRDRMAAKGFLQLALWSDSAPCYQCGRPSRLSIGDQRTQTYRTTGSAVPVSTLSLLEQQNRAGPSFRKETGSSQSMVPIPKRSTENDRGIRSNEHDSKRADPLAAKHDTVGQVRFIEQTFGLAA